MQPGAQSRQPSYFQILSELLACCSVAFTACAMLRFGLTAAPPALGSCLPAHVACRTELAVFDADHLHRELYASHSQSGYSEPVSIAEVSQDENSPCCQVLQASGIEEALCCAEADFQLKLLLNFSWCSSSSGELWMLWMLSQVLLCYGSCLWRSA